MRVSLVRVINLESDRALIGSPRLRKREQVYIFLLRRYFPRECQAAHCLLTNIFRLLLFPRQIFTDSPCRSIDSIDIRAHNRISRTVLAHKQLRVPSSRHGQTRRCALRAKSVACLYSTFNFPLCALNKQHSLNDSERAGDLHRRSRSQHDIPRRTQALTPAHASARPQ